MLFFFCLSGPDLHVWPNNNCWTYICLIWVSFMFQQFGQLVQYVFEFLTEPSKVKIAQINSLPTG